ncbi:MAG: CinA family nicotinamide mononucleotide deamidase-related protein [Chlamydiae bacterium]|nr:CinA family nicotinamide mononucleotide deamidase-related protein [Chlamydiota bacterium]
MNIEIIAIGNELLLGNIANTNAAYMSKELAKKGLQIKRHTVLPDDEHEMEEGLKQAWQRSEVVLLTGGLGPTCDDVTRKVLAKFFHSGFVYSEEIAKELQKRFGDKLGSIQDQATILDKAKVLPNQIGTAPGFLFTEDNKILASMPGVPLEMKKMFIDFVLPLLVKKYEKEEKQVESHFHVCLLIENTVDPFLRELQAKYSDVSAGIYPSTGTLSIHFSSKNKQSLEECKKLFLQMFEKYVFSTTSERIEEALYIEMKKKGKTLAIAESCTGGAIGARITSLSGASDYFLGSLVTYANDWKEKFLHVNKQTLDTKGAVSKETVFEMIQGLLQETSADYVIAVSGTAGPLGGTPEKPVGGVWLGICKRGETPEIAHFRFPGNREVITACSVNYLLGGLWRKVAFSTNSFDKETLCLMS